MGVIADLRAIWSAPSVSDDGHWMTGGGAYGSGGVTITEDLALANPVVFACVNILMDALVLSPAILYDRLPDGSRQRSTRPLAYRLTNQPNDEQTAAEFFREMQQSAAFYPFAYGEIGWIGGDPVNVWPRHPSRIRVDRAPTGKRYGYLDPETNQWRGINPSDMLRVPGRPVLRYAGETIGHALSLQRYSTKLFGKGVRPSALISTAPDEVWSETAKQKLKDEIEATHGGPDKAGGVLIMDGRLKWTSMAMTNQEAELSALLSNIVGDLVRWWRIPPYMVGLLESGTVSYASVNTQGVDFVVYCLMPWLVGWEQAMQRDLLERSMRESMFIEFLTAALLRGTTKERYEVYQIALSTVDPVTGQPILTVDEIRRLENLNPHSRGYVPTAAPMQTPAALAASLDAGSPAQRYLHSLVSDAAGRVLRREQGALAKLAERSGPDARAWEAGVREFYAEHPRFVADALKVPATVATAYASDQARTILADGPAVAAMWNGRQTDHLVTLALSEGLREAA